MKTRVLEGVDPPVLRCSGETERSGGPSTREPTFMTLRQVFRLRVPDRLPSRLLCRQWQLDRPVIRQCRIHPLRRRDRGGISPHFPFHPVRLERRQEHPWAIGCLIPEAGGGCKHHEGWPWGLVAREPWRWPSSHSRCTPTVKAGISTTQKEGRETVIRAAGRTRRVVAAGPRELPARRWFPCP